MDVILEKDCIEGMKELANESVDIIIADPPYNIGKDFGNKSDKQDMNDYLVWCEKWIEEGFRILKPKGTMFIYGFSEILAFIRVRIDLSYNVRWLVWHYTNKNTPTAKFWCRSHESILCCSKDKHPNFNRDDVREPYTEGFVKNAAGKTRKATKGRFSNGEKETVYKAHENGALPRDVIKISALAGGAGKKERVDHPTQKPLELCRKLIKSSRNKEADTLMIIPFAGSGSECVASKELGVNFIAYEINPEYIELCRNRVSEVVVEHLVEPIPHEGGGAPAPKEKIEAKEEKIEAKEEKIEAKEEGDTPKKVKKKIIKKKVNDKVGPIPPALEGGGEGADTPKKVKKKIIKKKVNDKVEPIVEDNVGD